MAGVVGLDDREGPGRRAGSKKEGGAGEGEGEGRGSGGGRARPAGRRKGGLEWAGGGWGMGLGPPIARRVESLISPHIFPIFSYQGLTRQEKVLY